MSFQNYPDGLYLVTQWSFEKKCDHDGILDIGNRLRHPQLDRRSPVIVHQARPSIRWDWLANTGSWKVLGRITDEEYAIRRLKQAIASPGYSLFGHNCEHFARFVATGKRESTQLQGLGVVVGIAALFIVALRAGAAAR